MEQAVYKTDFPRLKLLRRGKVRDMYDLGEHLLMVATDRISAFDVVMPNAVPGKGKNFNPDFTFLVRRDETFGSEPRCKQPGRGVSAGVPAL